MGRIHESDPCMAPVQVLLPLPSSLCMRGLRWPTRACTENEAREQLLKGDTSQVRATKRPTHTCKNNPLSFTGDHIRRHNTLANDEIASWMSVLLVYRKERSWLLALGHDVAEACGSVLLNLDICAAEKPDEMRNGAVLDKPHLDFRVE
jgi:hypothetical protein